MTLQADKCQSCPLPKKKSAAVYSNTKPAVTPGKKTRQPPAARNETCNVVSSSSATTGGTTVPNGESTTTEVQVPCLGPAGPEGWGFKWESEWAEGKDYVQQKDATPRASTVRWNNNTYVCIKDHTSTIANSPVDPNSSMEFKGEWAAGEVYTAYEGGHKASTVTYGGMTWYCIQSNIADESTMPGAGGEAYWQALDTENGSAGEGTTYWELFVPKGADGTSQMPAAEKSTLDKLKQGWDDVMDWVENASLEDWLKAGAIGAGLLLAGSLVKDALTVKTETTTDASAGYNGSPGYSGTAQAPSLRSVVSSLCDYVGVAYDASALSDSEPILMTIASNTQIRTLLEQLSVAYSFDMVDSAGVLKFVPKAVTPVDTITLEDMGFGTSSDSIPTPYSAKRFQGVTLPRSVSITYMSPDMEYNSYSQKVELIGTDAGQDVNIQVPLVLSHERAAEICETTLINANIERTNYKFNTSYKFIHLEPGDIVEAPMGMIRITKMEEGDEGILEFEACAIGDESSIQGSGLNVQLPTLTNNKPKVVTQSGYFFIDPPVLDDQDTSVRIYVACHGYGLDTWSGSAIYMSTDNGASFDQVGFTTQTATVGLVESVTPYTDYHGWDETTQITVKLAAGDLLSKSDIAVLNGANRCMVGQEIIGFKNATLIGEKTYRLSGLLRGRQGTEWACSTHQADELFVLLDENLVRIELSDADRGTTKKFKVCSIGSDISATDPISVQVISNNTRAWAPHTPTWTFVGPDLVLNWKERVRFDNQLKDYAEINHDPDWGGYGIAVLDQLDNVKSTHTMTSTTFTYTNAMQVADFGQLAPHTKFSIIQMSTKFGGGYPLVINT